MIPLRESGDTGKPGIFLWIHTCYRCGANPRDRPLRAALAHLQQWCPFLPVGL